MIQFAWSLQVHKAMNISPGIIPKSLIPHLLILDTVGDGDVVGPLHMIGATSAQGLLDLPNFYLTTSMY